MEGTVLVCTCQKSSGQIVESRLDMASCGSDTVANFEGKLTCMAQPGGNLPPGSYIESCRECSVTGKELKCTCRTRDGRWLPSQFDTAANCPIGNNNGILMCE